MFNFLSSKDDRFLFDTCLLVRIQDDTRRNSRLRLQIQRSADVSPFSADIVQIHLFDENDPYSCYSAQINDEVFQRLKIQQHLIIDFAAFPQTLVELLRMCSSEESLASPRYQCELRPERISNSAVLDITEVNGFKKLVHLSIRLNQADEGNVRKNMITTLTRLKNDKDRLEEVVRSTESKLHEQQSKYERQLESQRLQIEKMKAEFEHDMNQLRSRVSLEVRRDTDGLNREMQDRMDRLCLEKSDIETSLKSRLSLLEEQIQSFESQKASWESRLRESQAEAQQTQLRLSQEKETNRMLQDRLDVLNRTDPGKENSELRLKLAEMKVDLETARSTICKVNMEKRHLEESLEHKQGQVERRDAGIKTMSDDILKANDIIQKLQAEIKTYHSKLKVRSDVIMKQEELLESKDKELRSLRKGIENQTDDPRLQQLEKQIAHKDSVIQWLNKKLNELQGHKVDTPLMTAPSPLQENNPATFGRHLSNRPR